MATKEAAIDGLRVRVLNLGGGSYACMTSPNWSMDLQLDRGVAPAESMRNSAKDMRDNAARLLNRAYLIEQAAKALEA